MTTSLLDANLLIALVVGDQDHHRRTSAWVAQVERLALCPVVKGALVRYLVSLVESRDGRPATFDQGLARAAPGQVDQLP